MQIKEGNADHPQNIRNKIVGCLFPVMIFFMLVLVLLGRSLRGKESEKMNENKSNQNQAVINNDEDSIPKVENKSNAINITKTDYKAHRN